MARKVFFSFHYIPDGWRAAQIRNAGVLEGNQPVSDNDWETITSGGDQAIKDWIIRQQAGKSCAVVLIGANTANRKWVNFEIEAAWNAGMGVVGVYVHNLRDSARLQSSMGTSPFTPFTVCSGSRQLSGIVKAYNPNSANSKTVYDIITTNIEIWVDEAIQIRRDFEC
jgi:hypothetical protein